MAVSSLAVVSFLLLLHPVFQESDIKNCTSDMIGAYPVITEDTLVNYNKLVRAGYFYGQKFADKKLGLTAADVSFFNDLWKEVFNVPYYQTGISANEFVIGARFGEGNQVPFPPSSLYYEKNPDTYLLFHIAKEVGMINSKTFATCPSCVELSIAKINAYLKVTQVGQQLSVEWPESEGVQRFLTREEITTFWENLRTLFPDKCINPKSSQY